MADADASATVEALKTHAGESLRVVATYDEDGYDALYVRDGMESRLATHADDVHEELVLQGLGHGHLEDLFGAGELSCSMHRFEDLIAFHFVSGEFSGLFVSLDADTDVPLATFADLCERHL
jgi:hypothetical protein